MLLLTLVVLALQPVPAGVYTNEEEVYFAREAGQTSAPWTGLRVSGDAIERIDSFGAAVTGPPLDRAAIEPAGDRLRLRLPDGTVTELRRARPFTCWASLLRPGADPRAEGAWTFQRGLALHDQGGRVKAGGGEVPEVSLRIRNVIWPAGNRNRPSLVLYIHRDDPDRAESYGWADPAARLLGINLRWVQASCTLEEGASR